jgi:hypothetical protein
MDIIIKLEKEDINTSRIGRNYQIKSKDFSVICSPEAVDELIKDFKRLKRIEEIEFILTKLQPNQIVIYKGNPYHFMQYKDFEPWICPGPFEHVKDVSQYGFPVNPKELFLSK